LLEEGLSYSLDVLMKALGTPSIEHGKTLVEEPATSAVRYNHDNARDLSSTFARWSCSTADQCIAMIVPENSNSAILLHVCEFHAQL